MIDENLNWQRIIKVERSSNLNNKYCIQEANYEETKDSSVIFNKIGINSLYLDISEDTKSFDSIVASSIREVVGNACMYPEVDSDNSSQASTKLTVSTADSSNKSYKETLSIDKLQELEDELLKHKYIIEEILIKCSSHFKSKEKQETISFFKTLNNLVVQHIGKRNKFRDNKFFSNLLTSILIKVFARTNIVEGDLINYYCYSRFWSLDQLTKSISSRIDCQKLDSYLEENNIAKTSNKPKLKDSYRLSGSLDNYTKICMYMIEVGIDSNFFRSKNDLTSEGKLKNLIASKLDSYKKSNYCEDSIKIFISENKDLKYLVLQVFKKLKLISTVDQKLIYNDFEITNLKIDFQTDQDIIIQQLHSKIKEVLEENCNQDE